MIRSANDPFRRLYQSDADARAEAEAPFAGYDNGESYDYSAGDAYGDYMPPGDAEAPAKENALSPIDAADLCVDYPELKPVVVEGVCRQTETVNLVSV